jgi:hypothetical protein
VLDIETPIDFLSVRERCGCQVVDTGARCEAADVRLALEQVKPLLNLKGLLKPLLNLKGPPETPIFPLWGAGGAAAAPASGARAGRVHAGPNTRAGVHRAARGGQPARRHPHAPQPARALGAGAVGAATAKHQLRIVTPTGLVTPRFGTGRQRMAL